MSQLKALCEAEGLVKQGTKAELARRLLDKQSAGAAEPAAGKTATRGKGTKRPAEAEGLRLHLSSSNRTGYEGEGEEEEEEEEEAEEEAEEEEEDVTVYSSYSSRSPYRQAGVHGLFD